MLATSRVKETFDERNNKTTYEYDAAGRQTAVINALNQRTETLYDAAGRRTQVTDAKGQITRFEYDDAGRLLKTIHADETPADDADNPASVVTYNALGQKTSATDPAGRRMQFEYDGAGRLKAVIDNLNQRTEYSYDAQGNRLTQKDARGNVTKFGFDEMNRQVSRELPLGQREGMRYDGLGRLVEKTDFNGRSTTHQYDINDRLTQINHADGRTTLFQYNTAGQRTRSEQRFTNGAVEVTTYAYDERSRLIEVTYPDSSFVRYAYDVSGNRTQVITPSATIDYTFDELSRLETVIAPEGTSTYGYDPVGNRASETKPNGVTTTYTYNPRNQLTRMQHATAAGAVLLGLSYTLDASGMRHGIAEYSGASETTLELRTTRDYSYDPLMRLTAETVSCGAGNALCAPRTTTWTYDAVGNRLLQTEDRGGSVATTSYVYDANDRLLSSVLSGVPVNGDVVGTTTNRYDANGNLIETIEPAAVGSRRTLYGWDSDDKLTSAAITESVDGVSTSTESRYTYNADGIRRTQTARFGAADATTIQYRIDPNQAYAQVLEETVRPAVQGGAGQLVVRYTYGDDLLAQVRTGVDTPNVEAGAGVPSASAAIGFYHYDGLGTTRLLTDATGSVTDQYAFEAFGEKDEASSVGSTANNYLYTGEQYDPNLGSYYLRARYRNATSGRFLSMDSFSGFSTSPSTLHRYAYVSGNPVSFIDPSGLVLALAVPTMTQNAVRTISLRTIATTRIGGGLAANQGVYAVVSTGARAYHYARNAVVLALALSVKSRGKDRLIGVPILFTGTSDGMPETSNHISDAQAGAGSTKEISELPLTYFLFRSRRMPGSWYDSERQCNDAARLKFAGASTCDEYPFGSTVFGGTVGYNLNAVSLRLVPRSEQNPQGQLIDRFYRKAAIGRFEDSPLTAGFIAVAGSGESWCTDRSGDLHPGCR